MFAQHAQIQGKRCVMVSGQASKSIKHAEPWAAERKVRRTVPQIILQTETQNHATEKTEGQVTLQNTKEVGLEAKYRHYGFVETKYYKQGQNSF